MRGEPAGTAGLRGAWERSPAAVAALGACLAYAAGTAADVPALRVPAGVVLVCLAPGWLALRVARYRGGRAGLAARAVGGSLGLAAALPLAAEAAGVAAGVAQTGGVLCAGTAALAVAAWWRAPRPPAPSAPAPGGPAPPPSAGPPAARRRGSRRLAGAVVALLGLGLGAAAWGLAVHSAREVDAAVTFTQVGLVPDPGTRGAYHLSVTNREGRPTDYRVQVVQPGGGQTTHAVRIAAGDTWTSRLTADGPGTLEAVVHGGTAPPAGYRRVTAVVR
ncbi:MAG TPA: hypothetical protein VFY17_11725 [Pilimelia sp.]|nr:hypothetical protein [Pilimelia sp.]